MSATTTLNTPDKSDHQSSSEILSQETLRQACYQLIKGRRSIRDYQTTGVSRELVERVIQAGMWAPSGKNRQNWRFFVVDGAKKDEYLKYSQKTWENVKDRLKVQLKPSLYEFTQRFFYTLGNAPVVIFCYAQTDLNDTYLTAVGSVYMAVQNMNLAAFAEGLGTCTMGAPLDIKDEVNHFLGVTELSEFKEGKLELLCAISLGYPNHKAPAAARQLEGRITWC